MNRIALPPGGGIKSAGLVLFLLEKQGEMSEPDQTVWSRPIGWR